MLKRLLKLFALTFLILASLLGLFVAAVNYGVFGHLYSKEEIKGFENETASLVFSKDGKLLGKYFHQNRTNITYDQLPEQLVNALVATEDARYFEHDGVDSRSLIRVLFKTILLNDKRSGGGSTITQQLAKNMYGRKRFGPLTMPINKVKEAILANRIEEIYTKEEILSLYLNTVPFGENVYGIEAASRRFFTKKVDQLKCEESALLIGMLKANTYYNPRLYPDHALARRNVVLSQMEKYDYLDETTTDSLQNLELELDYANLESEGPANYFLARVKKRAQLILEDINRRKGSDWELEKDGLIIRTTLNNALQEDALHAFEVHLSKMQKAINKQYKIGESKQQLDEFAKRQLPKKASTVARPMELFSWEGYYTDSITVLDSLKRSLLLLQAGIIGLNPQNGEIMAWVGGIDYRSQPYDQILARRQLASAFKPILYAAALEEGFEPCDYLDNDPIILSDHDDWSPENYDHTSGGNYSMAGALSKSLNIPTVNLYFNTGFESVDYLWEKMEFKNELRNSPATALGTGEASLLETAIAYASFANGGDLIEATMILSIESPNGDILYEAKGNNESEKILSERTSDIINEILQKAIKEGTGVAMKATYGVDLPLAGKTGTSQNYSDAWFIAYNPDIVLATRVGASSPSIHFNSGAYGSGSRLALPLVALTLQKAQRDKDLKKEVNAEFKPLAPEIVSELDCPDFKEDSGMEKLFDSFRTEKTTEKKKTKKGKKKKKKKKKNSIFNKIFN